MTKWTERSPEVAALLNPAFCGVLIQQAVDGFCSQRAEGMPFELAALVLPLVLHRESQEKLPSSIRSPFLSWIAANPALQIGLSARVRASDSIFRESTMFVMLRGLIAVGENGFLVTGTARMPVARLDSEIRGLAQAAALVGRLLARTGNSATVYAALGLAP
jgi:Family of unknown function (DUF6521)